MIPMVRPSLDVCLLDADAVRVEPRVGVLGGGIGLLLHRGELGCLRVQLLLQLREPAEGLDQQRLLQGEQSFELDRRLPAGRDLHPDQSGLPPRPGRSCPPGGAGRAYRARLPGWAGRAGGAGRAILVPADRRLAALARARDAQVPGRVAVAALDDARRSVVGGVGNTTQRQQQCEERQCQRRRQVTKPSHAFVENITSLVTGL